MILLYLYQINYSIGIFHVRAELNFSLRGFDFWSKRVQKYRKGVYYNQTSKRVCKIQCFCSRNTLAIADIEKVGA